MRLTNTDFVKDEDMIWTGSKLSEQYGSNLRGVRKLENHKIYVKQAWAKDDIYYLVNLETNEVFRYIGVQDVDVVPLIEAYAEQKSHSMKSKEDIEALLVSLEKDIGELHANPDQYVDPDIPKRLLREKRTEYRTLLWVLGENNRFD